MFKNRIYIAFSKKKKTIVDYGIAGWTVGQYVHVELVLNGESYSSSAPDGGVRKKYIDYQNKNYWDLFEVKGEYDIRNVTKFFELTDGAKYDFKGIMLAQFLFSANKHDNTKYFCSEWVTTALRLTLGLGEIDKLFLKGYKFSPNRLHNYLNKYDLITPITDRIFTEV